MCSQMRSASQTSAMAATGSTLVVDVVPTVATTATGRKPAARSSAIAARSAPGGMRKLASHGMRRSASWPKPARITPLSMEECAWSEQ